MTRWIGRHRPWAALACLLMMAFGSGCSTTHEVAVVPPRYCDAPGHDCVSELMLALQDWQDAYNDRNPERLRQLYAPGALITDDEYVAVPQAGSALTDFFGDMARRPRARMRWVLGNLFFFGDTAVRSGECEFDDDANGQTTTHPVRYSLAYQRIDGRWLIVLQHLTRRP